MGVFNLGGKVKLDDSQPTQEYRPAEYNKRRTLVASAARVNLKSAKDTDQLHERIRRVKWQSDAWEYFECVGELKFSANLVGNTVSRVNIYPGLVEDTSRVPDNIRDTDLDEEYVTTAENILSLLENGNGGSAELLRLAAINLFVTGEFYLVKMPGSPTLGIPESWEVRSVDEIVTEGTGTKMDVYIRSTPDQKKEYWTRIPKNGFICRMWRKHPRYAGEADSSVRGVLDDCDDLILYGREERAAAKSRIASGILFIPDGLSDASVPDSDVDDDSDGTDFEEYDIADDITDSLVAPLGDDSNVHSVAPLVIRGSDEIGEKIKYITFNRPTDPMYQNKMEFKLNRILSSLDIPKDMAGGLSNVKYSNGSIIEEQFFKAHVEPMMLMVSDLLTTGFFRPALIANGVPPEIANKMVVWYDPSAILAKPSKSEAANFGVENNIVSPSAWRTANGFAETDAPDEVDLARVLLVNKLVLSDAALQGNLLELALPNLMSKSREESLGNSDPASANDLSEALGMVPDEGIISEDPQAEQRQDQTEALGGGDLIEP